MSLMASAFAPRKDHKGMSTPSYAARWYLPLCMVLVGGWAWGLTDGNLVMWSALTVMIATPVLSLGWYLIGLVSSRFEPLYILEKAERAHKARLERKSTSKTV
jgi:hypothetical protein